MKKIKAFTMAEAILVMTILGIIATIMITNIKPSKFKEQGYKVLAKSIYSDISTAITQITVDKSPYNKLNGLYSSDNSKHFSMGASCTTGDSTCFAALTGDDAGKEPALFVELLKLYLSTARGNIPKNCGDYAACTKDASGNYPSSDCQNAMLLKNGACLAVKSGAQTTGSVATWIPGESAETSAATYTYGIIYLDANGDDDPNTFGIDQFMIPLDEEGIVSGN